LVATETNVRRRRFEVNRVSRDSRAKAFTARDQDLFLLLLISARCIAALCPLTLPLLFLRWLVLAEYVPLIYPVLAAMPNVQRSATVTTRRRTDAVKKWTYNKERIDWRHTTTMNVRDLSNDDDFLSHMLVEKLGVGIVPLYVHRMDQIRRLPKTNADELLAIVRKVRHLLLATSVDLSV
jgi:hypothetical protein